MMSRGPRVASITCNIYCDGSGVRDVGGCLRVGVLIRGEAICGCGSRRKMTKILGEKNGLQDKGRRRVFRRICLG